MSYNYRYHQEGVGYIKRQQQLRQKAGYSKDVARIEGLFTGIGTLFSLTFVLLFKLIKFLFEFAVGLGIGLFILNFVAAHLH